MKIISVGGGPSALYFAILRKKSNPKDEIVLLERNLPYQTFGWGVVFSDETLSHFENADKSTHDEIVRRFAHWSAIDVHYKGECIRSVGHGFAGIARKDLLNVLQKRCEELGVQLVFEREVDDVDALTNECDLLLGADGVNSKVRKRWESAFLPTIDVRKCKYIWLGADLRFEAFTFIFAKNEHGIFQVHGYPFDETRSTFIVECDEDSWRTAGFDRMSIDDSVAYLEKLYAPWLGGKKLLTNKSLWINFPSIKNEHFFHENVVLMGDAVRTAHFSIGSGTKLAMEDSIALARAMQEHAKLPDALAAYEAERRDISARTQKAAQDSLLLFENVKRYYDDQDALEFSFNLMTRSKRITWDNLKMRDPALIERVQTSYNKAHKTGSTTPPMFTPYEMRSVRVENRVAVSPMCMYSARDGSPHDFHLVHIGARALGGAGLIFTEMTCISADARITPGCTGMYTPEHAAVWKRIVSFVHENSPAKIALQLGHAGRKGSTKIMWEGMDQPLESGGWPILSASAIPYYPKSHVPKAMDRADMDRVKQDFVNATKMAIGCGFDMLELHYAHGYLMASFLSPLTNQRTDEYGGAFEKRARYPLEVFDAVRAAWPEQLPMSVRISAVDWENDGATEEDSVLLARLLREHGCDIVHVSTGQTTPNAKPIFGRMWQTRFADRIRHEARVPVIAVGNIATGDQVNTILAAGRADLCAIARGHLDDPHFVLHAAKEQNVDVFWPPQYATAKLLRPLPK